MFKEKEERDSIDTKRRNEMEGSKCTYKRRKKRTRRRKKQERLYMQLYLRRCRRIVGDIDKIEKEHKKDGKVQSSEGDLANLA